MFGTHVVDPGTANRLALHCRLTSQVVQVANACGNFGDGRVFVAVDYGLLPETLLALGELQLHEGLEGILVHVFGWGDHAQFGQHGFLDIFEDAGGVAEIIGSGLQAFGAGTVRGQGELGVEHGEVEQHTHRFVFEVVLHERSLGIVAQGWVPGEVGTDVDRELARYPGQLGSVGLELLDAAGVGLADIDGVSSQGVDDLEVMTEHVGVLVILLGDVLADRGGEGQLGGLAEGHRQLVAARIHGGGVSYSQQACDYDGLNLRRHGGQPRSLSRRSQQRGGFGVLHHSRLGGTA